MSKNLGPKFHFIPRWRNLTHRLQRLKNYDHCLEFCWCQTVSLGDTYHLLLSMWQGPLQLVSLSHLGHTAHITWWQEPEITWENKKVMIDFKSYLWNDVRGDFFHMRPPNPLPLLQNLQSILLTTWMLSVSGLFFFFFGGNWWKACIFFPNWCLVK